MDGFEGMVSRVLVVDFGGQYTHLIARRCRELGVYSEVVEPEALEEELGKRGVVGVILSGGPRSVLEPDSPRVEITPLAKSHVPVLGICYGHQLLASLLGGRLRRGEVREYGRTRIRVVEADRLLQGLPGEFWAWMSHGDTVAEPPPGFKATSLSGYGAVTSMSDGEQFYSTQFHPEVVHTQYGKQILGNFLHKICGVGEEWRPSDRIAQLIEEIKESIEEDENVVCGVSGGVDSVTTAVLVSKAVGDRLHCIFVDTGLMRKGEREQVEKTLRKMGIKNLIIVEARERFLRRLRGVSDPEEKRKIIGEEFIRVFEEAASKIPNARWLAQGTIYPDRIESGRAGRRSALIKSHHNVGGLPQRMNLKVIEPLRDFYKDEVREVARALGIPREVVTRHPFPGPGLAVRIIGEVTEEKLRICREASAIVEEEFRRAGLYEKVWQAFAVVGDDKWVGVMGDERVEGYIVIVRVVESVDGMTADWHQISRSLLDRISRRITNEIPGVTMVTYASTSKPPSTIEPC